MPFDPVLAVDAGSPLGRRVLQLLTASRIPHVRALGQLDSAANVRALLIDAELPGLEHGRPRHIIRVREARPYGVFAPSPQLPSDPSGSIARTELLNHPYMEQLEPQIVAALATGRFLSATRDEAIAYVAHEDAAMVAAALLASDDDTAAMLRITGPEALHDADVVRILSEIFARALVLEHVERPALAQALASAGLAFETAFEAAHAAPAGWRGSELASVSAAATRIMGLSATSLRGWLSKRHDRLLAAAAQARDRIGVGVPSSAREGAHLGGPSASMVA